MRRLLATVILLAAVLAPVPNSRAEGLRVEVIDYGIYDSTVVGRYDAPRTVAGTGHTVQNIELVRQTERILGQLGTSFGLRYRIVGEVGPDDRLVSRTVHPPITNPETGRTSTVSETDISPFADFTDMYDAYAFDHRWELAEGLWRFQVIHNGRVIHEQRFEVVIPLN